MMDSLELIGQATESVVPQLTVEEETEKYARLIAEPLESGYGITLGNALRRVLLSSLEGAAITSVRIEQVQHEFSTIPGLQEDTTEFLLNAKEIRLRALAAARAALAAPAVVARLAVVARAVVTPPRPLLLLLPRPPRLPRLHSQLPNLLRHLRPSLLLSQSLRQIIVTSPVLNLTRSMRIISTNSRLV